MITFKHRMDAVFEKISFVQRKITAAILLCMIVVVTIQIVARPMRISIRWTEEVATYLLIWMTYLGSIGCVIKGEHLAVDLLLARYTPPQRRYVRIFVDVIIAIFCGIMLVFGIKLCTNPVIIHGNTPALGISRVWIYASLPISMAFSLFFILYDLIIAVTDLVTGGVLFAGEEVEKNDYEMK